MKHVIDIQTTAQTDTALIADPGDGRKIVIYGAHFGAGGANSWIIEHGTTTLCKAFVQTQSAHSQIGPFGDGPEHVLWEAPASTAVTYTTTAAPDQVIEVWYDVVTSGTQ